VELDLSEFAGRVPVELNAGSLFPPIGELNYLLTLPPYGFYWFALATTSDHPSWHTPAPEPLPEFVTNRYSGRLGQGARFYGQTCRRGGAAAIRCQASLVWPEGSNNQIDWHLLP